MAGDGRAQALRVGMRRSRSSLGAGSGALGTAAALVPLALLLSSLGPALGLDSVPFYVYYNDKAHLTTWAVETFGNAEAVTSWWDQLKEPCPQPDADNPGYLGVSCQNFGGNPQVTGIDLSTASLPPGSQFTGKFTPLPAIVGLQFLDTLNVSGQHMKGKLPSTLRFTPKLKRLDVSNNSFSGPISADLCKLNLTCVFYHSGLNLTNPEGALDCNANATIPSCWPQPTTIGAPPSASGTLIPIWAIVLIVLGGLLGVLGVVLGVVLWQKKRSHHKALEARRQLTELIESELSTRRFGALKRYTPEELGAACNGFSDDNYLGEGGFSVVYKGTLEDGSVVAIKKMKMDKEHPKKDVELSFINEVETISRAAHKNLAQCLGFCVETGESLMLALTFYANGSVATRTRGKEGDPLPWATRKRIAIGAADGIAYLHGDCHPQIIHRDIKAENVLLDEKDEPVVADFGLATASEEEDGERKTGIQGTLGHIAPEYFMTGKCSTKTDVYAFGVFLLELVSGKDIFTITSDPRAQEMGLDAWLGEMVEKESFGSVVDPELRTAMGADVEDGIVQMLKVACACVDADPNNRPTMPQVSAMLAEDAKTVAGSNWSRWKEEAGKLDTSDMLKDISHATVWDNVSTGVVLDASTLQGPGR